MLNVKEYDDFIRFSTLEEKIDKLKEWDLIGKRDLKRIISGEIIEFKPIIYKGVFTKGETTCDVIGYVTQKTYNDEYEMAVIEINGETNKINPVYLKQMQSKDFSILLSTGEEE
jgi:hypothetical protein